MTDQTTTDGLGYLNELATGMPGAAATADIYQAVQAISAGLRRMRTRHGVSQAALGGMLGVSQGRISQIESGLVDHAPSLDMIVRYAAACGEKLEIGFSGE